MVQPLDMTDPSRDIDIDSFMGMAAAATQPITTHFIGDDCPPDGHRSEAILATGTDTLGLDEPAEPEKPKRSKETKREVAPRERLVSLIYTSAHEDVPHVVSKHVYEGGVVDALCGTCKAAIFNMPVGCWAMVDARLVWNLPEQS